MFFENKAEFKGAVIGMVLGDGHLGKSMKDGKPGNSRLSIHHSEKQREYALWKAEMLEDLTNVSVREAETIRGKNEHGFPEVQHSVIAETGRHPFYTALRERLYVCGRKAIDDHCLKMLTPLGLAILYMDDGTLAHTNGTSQYSVILSKPCFSMPELELFSYRVHQKWGFRFKATRRGLQIHRWNDVTSFLDLVKPHIHPTMLYKIERTMSPIGKNLIAGGK